jgi:hypothetical protein
VVAIGACACTGQPSTSRNQFVSDQLSERIRWYLSHFDYGKEVKSLGERFVVWLACLTSRWELSHMPAVPFSWCVAGRSVAPEGVVGPIDVDIPPAA